MAITISGSTGVTYPNGGVDNVAGAGVGTTDTQTLTNKTIQGGAITSGTAVASTSGTSIDFTGIPSYVKRITVMFSGVSTSGTSLVQVQLGAGSILTSGYVSCGVYTGGSGAAAAGSTTGLVGAPFPLAVVVRSGIMVICAMGGNLWSMSCVQNGDSGTYAGYSGGSVSLSGTLDRVRITTVNGTDTFDAGSINILYE